MFSQHRGASDEQVRSAKLAGLLSDIGMIAVAPTILSKIGSLTRAERALLDEHARHGADLVEQVGLEEHQAAAELIRLHHEMWDGSGPNGLAGEEIPVEVRILRLCDSFDLMLHARGSRPPISVAAAVQDLEAESGKQFDPTLVQEFVRWIRTEYWQHRDFRAFLGEEAESNDVVKAKEQIARYVDYDAQTKAKGFQ
jgi:HD-GYP domain-containing protein (c-di-GMP phosphodiesterase class II)